MLYPSRLSKAGGMVGDASSTSPGHSDSRAVFFDGHTVRVLPLDGYANISTFTLDLRLISAELPKEPYPYTETTPTMPFLLGSNIVCKTDPGGYIVQLRAEGKDIALARINALRGATRITVVSSPEGAAVFGNGAEVVRIETPVVLDGAARVGAGHLKRFWAGSIEYFDVFDQALVDRNTFNTASPRLPADKRIATLEA